MEQHPGIVACIFGRGIFMMRKWVAVLVVLSLVGIVTIERLCRPAINNTDYY